MADSLEGEGQRSRDEREGDAEREDEILHAAARSWRAWRDANWPGVQWMGLLDIDRNRIHAAFLSGYRAGTDYESRAAVALAARAAIEGEK